MEKTFQNDAQYLEHLISLNKEYIMWNVDDEYLDDIEIMEQMVSFYNDFPEYKIIPFRAILGLQIAYNADVFCAGWCQTFPPSALINYLEKRIQKKQNTKY